MNIFISAVSSEFEEARTKIASDLRARGLTVKVQEDFRKEVDSKTTLELLHNYIKNCDAVVCIVGKRHGARPSEKEVTPLKKILPKGFAWASYTQWELLFALKYDKRISLHMDVANSEPANPAISDEEPGVQAAFVRYIQGLGIFRGSFNTPDELRIQVLRQDWPNLLRPKPKVLPYLTLGPLFKGRSLFLKKISRSRKRGLEGGPTSTVIHGLGGAGKTRIAVEYAWRHESAYSALLFVTADTPESLQRNLAGLSEPSGLDLPEQHRADEDLRQGAVIRWLQRNPGWLLILDNVDSLESAKAVEKRLPELRGGHVIVTSRLSRWSASVDALELDVLTSKAATEFLLARTKMGRRNASDDTTKAQKLARELGQLALALEQAGAYIVENRLTFDGYLEELRVNHDKVLEWIDQRVMHYTQSVAITWQISVNRLTPPARCLLELLAWFAPDPIPESLLKTPIPEIESGEMHAALANLETYSLITRAIGAPLFSVHCLVQDVTRRSLQQVTGHHALAGALRIVSAFPRDSSDPRTWPACVPLLPHALATLNYTEELGVDMERTAILLNEVGIYLWARSELAQARELHQRALILDEKQFGPNHLSVANTLNNLGLVLWDLIDLSGARMAHKRAITIREKQLGPDHPAVAASLNNLGVALWDLAELAKAKEVHKRALAILKARLGDNHPAVVASLTNLGSVLGDLDELVQAREMYEEALRILDNQVVNEHSNPRTGIIDGAALHHSDLGELAIARAVLDTRLVRDDSRGPRVGKGIDSISIRVDSHFNPENGALPLTSITSPQSGLVDLAALRSSSHPTLVKTLENLGVVLTKLGELEKARSTFVKALEIREAQLGPDHPDLGWSLTNLGVILCVTGELGEARATLEKGLKIRQARLGIDHPDVATNLSVLGTVLCRLGELREAKKTLERALVIRESRLGYDHPATLRTRENLTIVVDLLGVSTV